MSHPDKKPGVLWPPSRIWRRRLIALAIVAAVLAAVAVIGGELLAPYAVGQIEAYTGTKVTVDSAKFGVTGTLSLRGLKVVTGGPYPSTLLQARKVSARFGLLSLLKGTPQLTSLTVTGGLLNIEYDPNSRQWNLAALVLKERATSGQVGSLPQMEVADCTVTLNKRVGDKTMAMLAVPLVFDARTTAGRGYEFHMTSRMPAGRAKPAAESWVMDVRGKVDNIGSSGDFSLEVVVHNLILSNTKAPGEMRVGRELAEVLHEELVRLWDKYKPDGKVDVDASLSGSLSDITRGQVAATFIFRDVALKYKYFPYLLEHVKGNIFFQNGDLVMEGLTGRHGQTEVSIAGWSRGSGKDWESDVTIHSDKAIIDEDVYMALTPAEKRIWRMFSPSGETQFDFEYKSQHGKELLSRATLTLTNAQMMYERFWHRFTNGTGTLTIEPNEIRLVGITSREENCVTTFNGKVTNVLGGRPDIDIKVRGSGMPISTRLLSQCAPELYRRQLDDFDFEGKMDFDLLVSSVRKPQWQIDYVADADISAPALRYVSKGLGLTDMSARVRLTPAVLSLSRIDGTYADSKVGIGGHIDIADDPNVPMCYQLTIDGNNVNIDKGVLSLIPMKNAGVLEEMQPSGRANISASLHSCRQVDQDSLSVECLGTQVHLAKIGYTLADMAGKVVVRGGAVEFEDLKARVIDPDGGEPGSTSIKGKMLFGKERLEGIDIQFEAEKLRFGSPLRQVVERLSPNLYDSVTPAGAIGLRQCGLRMGIDPNGQRFGDYHGNVVFQDCAFGKEELSKINAILGLTGFFEREMQRSSVTADLQASTIVVREKLLTDVRSHIEHRKGEKKWSLGNFSGNFYDGTLAGDVVISSQVDGRYSYSLQTAFKNVNMGRFLAKPGKDPNAVSRGTMDGTLVLSGDLGAKPTRTGELTLDVRDMQVGRMSFLAKVFTLLSLSVPGDVAFHAMKMTSRIQGDEIIIDDLVMSGDALNFKGAGRIDLANRMVDIDLAATSPTPTPGLLTSVMVGLRHAVVYLKVRGKLDDPTVNVTPLPLVDKAIQKILGTRE